MCDGDVQEHDTCKLQVARHSEQNHEGYELLCGTGNNHICYMHAMEQQWRIESIIFLRLEFSAHKTHINTLY